MKSFSKLTGTGRSRRLAGPAGVLLLAALPVMASDQGTLVVLNKGEATVSLIHLATGEIAATVPTGEGPHEVAVSPDGRQAVVTNYGTRDEPGASLTVIDIVQASVVRTIDLGEYQRPHGVVWLEGGRAVVTAESRKALILVDLDRGAVERAVDTGQEIAHMVAVSPAAGRAFVASIGSGTVTAIDLTAGRVLKTVATGEGAEGIDVTPDGKQVWITNRGDDSITVLDAHSLTVIAEIESSSFPIRARATPDGKHVLVSNARSGEVAVFDASTHTEVERISIPLEAGDTDGRLFGDRFGKSSVPIGILVHPDGKKAYVASANADVISILDLQSWEVRGTLTAGREPDGLGHSPLGVKGPRHP